MKHCPWKRPATHWCWVIIPVRPLLLQGAHRNTNLSLLNWFVFQVAVISLARPPLRALEHHTCFFHFRPRDLLHGRGGAVTTEPIVLPICSIMVRLPAFRDQKGLEKTWPRSQVKDKAIIRDVYYTYSVWHLWYVTSFIIMLSLLKFVPLDP